MRRATLGASALTMLLALGACSDGRAVSPTPPPPQAAAAPPTPLTPPAGMQYLYGSGEAAALSRQAYSALVLNVALRLSADEKMSVVLEKSATLDKPAFGPCNGKPPAAVFDMDETLVLNLGYEYNDALTGGTYDAARWKRFEQSGDRTVTAVPGAVEAVNRLREAGVTVIVNTNRNADTAEGTERALAFAGLGSFKHGETLYLKGDVDGSSGKDGRRAAIAQRYCVVAMGGDQLSDFSDLFKGAPAVRRAAAEAAGDMWGNGWFMLPNPVYGAGLAGGMDDVFPSDRRWVDPGANGGK